MPAFLAYTTDCPLHFWCIGSFSFSLWDWLQNPKYISRTENKWLTKIFGLTCTSRVQKTGGMLYGTCFKSIVSPQILTSQRRCCKIIFIFIFISYVILRATIRMTGYFPIAWPLNKLGIVGSKPVTFSVCYKFSKKACVFIRARHFTDFDQN